MALNDSCLSDELYHYVVKDFENANLYKPAIPPTRSLNSCEGDQNGDRIEFSFDCNIPLDNLTSIKSGEFLQSQTRPLSQGHILWSYTASICKRYYNDSYEFSLMSMGSHLCYINKNPDPYFNAPKLLKMPAVIAANMTIRGAKNEEVMKMNFRPLARSTQPLVAPNRFSMQQLIGLSVNNVIPVHVRIVVDRSYFSLGNIIDLDEVPIVPRKQKATVDQILRGEKPLVGRCWKVTVEEVQRGKGDTPGMKSFYIHKAAIEKAIPALKNFGGGPSYIKDLIKVTGPDSFEMSTLDESDMNWFIPLVYGAPVPLPTRWDGEMSTLVRTIRELFKEDIFTVLAPQWERAICEAALALDTRDVHGLNAIARLLAIVWFFPHGSMPVAKRVAVGVMADIVHRNTDGSFAEQLRVFPLSVSSLLEGQFWPILSVVMHLKSVALVRKRFLAAGQSADEEWHDAETIDNQKEEASKWACAIS